jgi:stage II sporulation protein D
MPGACRNGIVENQQGAIPHLSKSTGLKQQNNSCGGCKLFRHKHLPAKNGGNNLSNSSLMRCAAALLIMSVYVWLFGFSKDIGGETAMVFADQSAEFTRSSQDTGEESRSDGAYSDGSIGADKENALPAVTINPANDHRLSAVDLPARAYRYETTVPVDLALSVPEVLPPDISESMTLSAAASTSIEESSATAAVTTVAYTEPEPAETVTVTSITDETDPLPEITEDRAESENILPEETAPDETIEDLDELEQTEEDAAVDLEEEYAEVTYEETTTAETDPPAAEKDEEGGQLIVYDIELGYNISGSEFDIISKVVQNEIGSGFEKEAIKAQAVAAYTYCLLYMNNGQYASVHLASEASERVKQCVREVLGQVMLYNGELIQAVYSASSAGYTASAVNVWSNDIPYLRSVACPLDAQFDPNYGVERSFSSDDIMARILEKTGVELTGDPANWFQILNYVDSVYAGDMMVGGKTTYLDGDGDEVKFSGKRLRDIIGLVDLRSSSFDITYNPDSDKFIFTTYGYGHGVGLSQNGANQLAKYEGYNYQQILSHFYQGAYLGTY